MNKLLTTKLQEIWARIPDNIGTASEKELRRAVYEICAIAAFGGVP